MVNPWREIKSANKMRNKKAFMLGEHTLKVIIAVLCLLLLVYLLFNLYSSYQNEKNLRMAGASLDELSEKMSEAKEKGEADVLILNPVQEPPIIGELWSIISWPYENDERIPYKCKENCVCICTAPKTYEKLPLTSIVSAFLKECNSLGVCKDFDSKTKISNSGLFKIDGQIPIKNPPLKLKVKYNNKEGFEVILK